MKDRSADNTDVTTPLVVGEDKGDANPYLPKKRKAGQAKGSVKPKATKRPVKLLLKNSQYEALVITGLRRGMTFSDLVGELIEKHLNNYYIHARPNRDAG